MNIDAPWPDLDEAEARVLKIQTKLHQWATDDPGRRFDDLYNLVYDPTVLVDGVAPGEEQQGRAAAGVDGEPHSDTTVRRGGLLAELRDELKAGSSNRFPYAR